MSFQPLSTWASRYRANHIGGDPATIELVWLWCDLLIVQGHERGNHGIPLPKLLSLLAFHDPNATVQGLDAVPPDELPPINLVRIAFQTMVGIGLLLALLAVIFLVVRVRHKRLPRSEWFYRALAAAGPLSIVALICGWVTTEVGSQPWVVYGMMRTSQAVTGASGVPIGYTMLALVYLGLIVATAWVLRRLAAVPLRLPATPPPPAHTARR
jgi:cytochrome bd ubiquinol oxidase subunit I